MVSIRSDRHEPDAVATYPTLNGAERAVSHLVDLGYDEREVAIAPREFHVVKEHSLRRRFGLGLRAGAIVGASLGGLVELVRLVGAGTLLRSVVPAVAGGAIAGVVLGIIAAVAVHRREKSITYGGSDETVTPGRFEVRVDGETSRARHGLARWWDGDSAPR